ncbi:MAG: hypothetical protein AUI14_19105 [Actinobacteria bacterium 13_2_20CM_2_71_6]|nr:MAG: hypothetical protein AUI14_19105 [Actinobacteria bacterium 13_2_20CM_2_71_6]
MTDHHDTGTGWPDRPPAETAPPAEAAPPVKAAPPEPDPAAGPNADAEPEVQAEPEPEVGQRDWDVDGAGPDEPEPDDAAAGRPASAEPPGQRRKVSAAGAAIGLLLVLFGFAFVIQLRSNATDEKLSTARPEDLVRILSDLDARKDRLSQEIGQLQTTQQQLAAGSQGRAAALDAAAKRARDLGILAGTLPAQGPGIQVQFLPGAQGLRATVILDAVQELRDAGAEALEIDGGNGGTVRIVASSWFADSVNNGLEVDGRSLTGPYWLTAIGDPQTMRTALNIPGGVVDTVHNAGGNVIVNQPGTVRVSALHQTGTPRYAQPAS